MILLFTNYLTAAAALLCCIIPTIPFHYKKEINSKYVEEVTECVRSNGVCGNWQYCVLIVVEILCPLYE